MGIISDDSNWLSSTAAAAQRKVSDQVTGIARSCSSKMGRCVHPDGVAAGMKVGDIPDEPRQWTAFEYADIMEQGLSGGLAGSFMTTVDDETRLLVNRSPDKKELLLTDYDGKNLLLARLCENGDGFNIFVTADGDPPLALGPAFSMSCNTAKDRWTLKANTCNLCESRGRRVCGSRVLANMSHHIEKVEMNGDAKIMCMDLEIPAVSEDGLTDMWCPVCKGEGTEQKCVELTTRRPKWNNRAKTLTMDFFGRCKLASAKNFQLEEVGKAETMKLLFGKAGESQFVLDFHRPLSPVQAFAAAISTMVWK